MHDRRRLGRFFYARLPLIWASCKAYTGYRLECALRASAILGFIGLPTLGFHLETAFREGHYGEGAFGHGFSFCYPSDSW